MDETTEVLVVGGGLVGLSAAMFLADRGVPVVLAEKHPGSSAHPRAIGYTVRTLELFARRRARLPALPRRQAAPRPRGEPGRAVVRGISVVSGRGGQAGR